MKNRWLSWPGAKFRQLDKINENINISNKNIMEPYLGTAAFSLQNISPDRTFYWAEKNQYLSLWWEALLYETDTFISLMSYFRNKYINAGQDRDVFNEMRDYFNSLVQESSCHVYLAPLLWVLVYQSTNNLARFNKKGGYNQTWGKGRKVPDPLLIFNEEAKKDIDILRENVIRFSSDQELMTFVKVNSRLDNACFYFDPPYILRTEVYDKDWTIDSEKSLFEDLNFLDEQNTPWFMTNYLAVSKEEETIEHPFISEIKERDWALIPLDRKLDARPTSNGNSAEEYIIVGKNKEILKG